MVASPAVEAEPAPPDTYIDDEYEGSLEGEEDDLQEKITEPFDPELIKIRTIPILVGQLVDRIKYGEIELVPDFQRHARIWNPMRRSRLIESLLLKIPIPVFYVAADEDDNWSVVDGVQRMTTIYEYVTGGLPLIGLQYLIKLDGCKHDALSRPLQRRISETQLIINVIEPGTPPEVMFNVFLRINTGGLSLNGQEIRHALNPGPVREYLEELAKSREFIRAAPLSETGKNRMQDRECVLRFLAFRIESWESYNTKDLDRYLGSTMQQINNMAPKQRDTLAADFKKAMCAAFDIFGENAFRKPPRRDNRRGPINRALLEAWSVQLARCSPEQIKILVEKKDYVQRQFIQLVTEDQDFERSISFSTGTPWRVQKRFQAIEQLVKEFV